MPPKGRRPGVHVTEDSAVWPMKGLTQRTQGLSQTSGESGSLRGRGKHSLAPSGVDSTDLGSDLSPNHSPCVSVNSLEVHGALWFSQQWAEGNGEPGGTDVATWLYFSLE